MELPKVPFKSYTLDEEREKPKRDIISVSLNPQERIILNEFKRQSLIHLDSTALKFLAFVGANVIHSTLGPQNLRYLASKDRIKLMPE